MVSRIAALLLCCTAVPAFGQDTTAAPSTTHFRRGQWVAHFDLGSFTTFGVSRFRSPTRAIVLQFSVSARHAEQSDDSSQWAGTESSGGLTARVGWRAYRSGLGRVTPYFTFGPLLNLTHSYSSTSGYAAEINGWGLGFFTDLGALYHVAEWLALGAAGNVDLSYNRRVYRLNTAGGSINESQWEIALSGVTARAGLTIKF